jgi:tetratricopeptide (TPR) repeat protein
MSPEQIMGEVVDARSDVYALGCVLYELLVGHPPFAGDAASVVRGHLNRIPPAPSELVRGIPEDLDELALRMLAKEPQERIGYVDDVQSRLGALVESESIIGVSSSNRPHLYRPPFVGRGHALQMAILELTRVSHERGRLIVVEGGSGLGKTRFANEVARQARRDGMQVLNLECSGIRAAPDARSRSGALYAVRPFLQAVADRCQVGGIEETRRLLSERGPILAPYEPGLHMAPGSDGWKPAPEIPISAARTRLFQALSDTLEAYATDGQVLMVVDDLQWADELTLGWLEYLAQGRIVALPVLVLATVRSDALSAQIDALVRLPQVDRIELTPLATSEIGEVVAGALGTTEQQPGLTKILAGRCHGNPFFVTEYLRLAIKRGLLVRSRDGGWTLRSEVDGIDHSLPKSAKELSRLRLESLPNSSRRLVAWMAILGRGFSPAIVSSGCALEGETLEAAVDELQAEGILETIEGDELRFVHDRLREVAYEEIPEAERKALHRTAAERLESHFAGTREYAFVRGDIGQHWAAAGESQRAVPHFMAAAEAATRVFSNELAHTLLREADKHAQHLIEVTGQSSPDVLALAASIQEALGVLLSRSAKLEEARLAFERAVQLSDGSDRMLEARCWRCIAKTWVVHHRHDEALACLGRSEEVLGLIGGVASNNWRGEWIDTKIEIAWVYYWLARVPEMQEQFDALQPVVTQHGTPFQRARLFEALVLVGHRRERYAPSVKTIQNTRSYLTACIAAGSLPQIALAHFMMGFGLLFRREIDKAEQELGEALSQARYLGDVALQARSLSYLTIGHRLRGDLIRVRETVMQALEVATAGQMAEYIGLGQANLAWASLREGGPALARLHAEAALGNWAKMPVPYPFKWTALLPLAAIYLRGGSVGPAIAVLREILEPPQQVLTTDLSNSLGNAVRAWDEDERSAARRLIVEALEHARLLGFI